MPRTIDYAGKLAAAQQALEEQLAKLKGVNIDALEAKKQKHYEAITKEEAAIAAIDGEIGEALAAAGIHAKASGKGGGKPKRAGIQVSANRLKELFKEAKADELSIRKAGLDAKQVRQLAADNSKDFKFIENGPQPRIKLLKK